MHSEEILTRIASSLDKLEKDFHELASSSEFEKQRRNYLDFEKQLKIISKQVSHDLKNISDYESFTGSLDRV